MGDHVTHAYSASRFPTRLGFDSSGGLLFSTKGIVGSEIVPLVGSLDPAGQLNWVSSASEQLEIYALGINGVAYGPGGEFILVGEAGISGGSPEPYGISSFVWRLSR